MVVVVVVVVLNYSISLTFIKLCRTKHDCLGSSDLVIFYVSLQECKKIVISLRQYSRSPRIVCYTHGCRPPTNGILNPVLRILLHRIDTTAVCLLCITCKLCATGVLCVGLFLRLWSLHEISQLAWITDRTVTIVTNTKSESVIRLSVTIFFLIQITC